MDRKDVRPREEYEAGLTPGVDYPVFDTDFGRVGISICYDSWFPEIYRALGLSGAELVLLPNAGYYEDLMPARAADSGIWVAVSTRSASGSRSGAEISAKTVSIEEA